MPSVPALRFALGPLAALGLLAGCDRRVAEPVTLAGLRERSLQFTLTDVDSVEERESSVGAYRFTLLFYARGAPCVRLEGNVTATLNGQPMRLSAGGVPDTGVGGREVCEPPRATFDFDPVEWRGEPQDLSVLLQDDTHTVRLVLQRAQAKRRFVREGTASGTLRRGQTHAYRWEPQTDPAPAAVQARIIHEATGISSPLTVEQQGHTSRFLLPSDTIEGDYVLRLQGSAEGPVLTCEGVARCEGLLVHSEDFEVAVVP